MLRRRNLTIAAVTAFVPGRGVRPGRDARRVRGRLHGDDHGRRRPAVHVPERAAGHDPTSLPLPVQLPIVSVAQSCPPVTATTPAVTVTTTTQPQTTSTSTSTSTSTTTKRDVEAEADDHDEEDDHDDVDVDSEPPTTTSQSTTRSRCPRERTVLGSGKTSRRGRSRRRARPRRDQPPRPRRRRSPRAACRRRRTRRTRSSLPGPAPIGVPNFFIDSFQIPPFLLPIYQAAGIQYDVPWQVLAAINEIETDYGRNLSVSTAGAVGWMQFLPSTWKRWGVDANGDGVADPYNPADAIFTAARYLHAAGASKNLSQAIFAYNHAGWYVQSVLLRAAADRRDAEGRDRRADRPRRGALPGRGARQVRRRLRPQARQDPRQDGATRRSPVDSNPKHQGHRDLRQAGLAGDRGQRRQDRQDRRQPDSSATTSSSRTRPATPTRTRTSGRSRRSTRSPSRCRSAPRQIAKALLAPATPAPKQPATAGSQQARSDRRAPPRPPARPRAPRSRCPSPPPAAAQSTAAPASADPVRRDAVRHIAGRQRRHRRRAGTAGTAGGHPDDQRAAGQGAAVRQPVAPGLLRRRRQAPGRAARRPRSASFDNYFSDVLHLAKNQYTLEPLKAGSIVVAGTILGRLGAGTADRRLAPASS